MRQQLRTLLLGLVGLLLAATGHPAQAGPQAYAEQASQQLQQLLDTSSIAPALAYQRLGLQMGTGVRVFYQQQNFRPSWTQEHGWLPHAQAALLLLRQAATWGLPPTDYARPGFLALADSLAQLPEPAARNRTLAGFELQLTDVLLRFALDLHYGRLQPGSSLPRFTTPAQQHQAAHWLHQALACPDWRPTLLSLQPAHLGYQQLLRAWQRQLRRASPSDSVAMLEGSRQSEWQQVAINLERRRWFAPPDSLYLLVNIAAYRLDVYRYNQVLRTHRVVVGKPTHPTPELDAPLRFFTTAPEWRVPQSIAVNEVLPQLRRNPGYLYKHRYRLLNRQGQSLNPYRIRWATIKPDDFPYVIKQRPGPENSLGLISFYMPNAHAVYLHDTPALSLFAKPMRAYSHGCVRVQQPVALAAFLLRRAGVPDRARQVEQWSVAGYTQQVKLPRTIPVYLRYFTCETDAQGRVRYLADVYGQDAALKQAFFAPSLEGTMVAAELPVPTTR